MAENEWASLLDTLTEAWNKISIQFEELSKAISDMFDSLMEAKIDAYMAPRKRYRPPKKINCTYSVERRVQRHLPYQRRNY